MIMLMGSVASCHVGPALPVSPTRDVSESRCWLEGGTLTQRVGGCTAGWSGLTGSQATK